MPRAPMDLVVDMVKDGATNVPQYLRKHLQSLESRNAFEAQWAERKPIEQAVMIRIAHGEAQFSAATGN